MTKKSSSKSKRIATDLGGYGLILLGISTGWLPGPGGIPLVLAGLGLLSVHNVWAQKLRDYILRHGGDFVKVLFPDNRFIQIMYDLIVALLLVLVAVLAWERAALWQVSLATGLFFVSVFIASLNRDRGARIKKKIKKS